MNQLLAFINSLSEIERERFAKDVKTSIGYLRKAISANHQLTPALCVRIESASNKMVPRQVLRPNDWMDIWPELQNAA